LFVPEAEGASFRSRWEVQIAWIATAFAIGIAGTIGLGLLGQDIANLALAREYRSGASLVMVIMGLAQTFSIMTHAADNAILSTGASAALLKAQAYLIVSTVLLIALSIVWFGVMGAVAGRAAAECLKFGATFWIARRLLKP
jgi:O-antigen/teichoic acid export membrane protein